MGFAACVLVLGASDGAQVRVAPAGSDTVIAGAPVIRAAGRGGPRIQLLDGFELPAAYVGHSESAEGLAIGSATPLALAAGDFDEDGTPDLVVGYAVGPGAGIVALHRGSIDAVHPGSSTIPAFLPEVPVVPMAGVPQWLAALDSDADGHLDIVAAAMGSDTLQILVGDGAGGFREQRGFALAGRVTAIAAGEIGRADGLADLAVGLSGTTGPELYVFGSPRGALAGDPGVFELPSVATAIAIGQWDRDYPFDLAVTAGDSLVIVHGRDRLDVAHETVPVVVDRHALPYRAVGMTAGHFDADPDHRMDLALLADDGAVRIVRVEPQIGVEASAITEIGSKSVLDAPFPALMSPITRANLSSFPNDDLVVLDPVQRKLHVLMGQSLSEVASFDVTGAPTAVRPMRLNAGSLDDVVVLVDGLQSAAVAYALLAPTTFVVDSTANEGDITCGDQVCNAAHGGGCTLRAAIQEANCLAGEQIITFDLGAGTPTITPASELPAITDPVSILGNTGGATRIQLNGASTTAADGLTLAPGSDGSTVRALVINGFDGYGLQIESGSSHVENCWIGTDASGTNTVAGNGSGGVHITGVAAVGNTIGGTTSAARNVISNNLGPGVWIDFGPTANAVSGNYIGTNATGTTGVGNNQDGVLVTVAADNVIGGLTATPGSPPGNLIADNVLNGVVIRNAASGNMVQGNLIGTTVSGMAALPNLQNGVLVGNSAQGNTVGGSTTTSRNVISGNGTTSAGDGVEISGSSSTLNAVVGNYIGVDASGMSALGNAGRGVRISSGASNNSVGSTTGGTPGACTGECNTIAFNDLAGVAVMDDGSIDNPIRGNSIHDNGGLGIDLIPTGAAEGVTPNDACPDLDPPSPDDMGPNRLQNYPIISHATLSGGMLQVTLGFGEGEGLVFDFYSNTGNDPSGHGEGRTWIGSYSFGGDCAGDCCAGTVPAFPVDPSTTLASATATDAAGNTSEFSETVPVGSGVVGNDRCSRAEVVPTFGPFPWATAYVPDIAGATTVGDPPAPTCGGPSLARSLWYTFKTPGPAGPPVEWTITSCADETGTTVDDTVIAVYSCPSGCADVSSCVQVQGTSGCADDSCATQASLTVSLIPEATYHFVVWEKAGGAGGAERIKFRIGGTPPCPTPPVPPTLDHPEFAPAITADPSFLGENQPVACLSLAADDRLFLPDISRSRSVWLGKITPATRAYYRFSTCAGETATDIDNLLAVQDTGSLLPSFYDVGSCPGGRQAMVVAPLEAGVEYVTVGWVQGDPPVTDESIQMLVELVSPANDTCDQAIPLALDTPVAGSTVDSFDDYQLSGSACFTGIGHTASTAPGRDVAYSFTAPDADTYSFSVTGYSPTSRNLVLYTSSACEAGAPPVVLSSCLAAANRQSSGSAEEVMCLSLAAGQTVYAYVDEHAFTDGASFAIEVNRCALERDAFNHQAGNGLADEPACPLQGRINVAGDSDWITMFVTPGERLFALVDGVAGGDPDFDLRVLSRTETTLEYDDQDNAPPFGDASPSVSGTPLTPGSLFTRLTHKSSTIASEPYRLYSAVQWPSDTATAETEPNDTPGGANSAPNAYFTGSISTGADQDHYSFTASAGELIFLGLDADPLRDGTPFYAGLALLDASGAVLVAVNDANSVSDTTPGAPGSVTSFTPHSPGEALVYRARTSGSYVARVQSGGSTTGDYLLSVSIDCKVLPATDVSVVMSDFPDPVLVGSEITYSLVITNVGSVTPKGLRLVDDLPPNVTLVSTVPSLSGGGCAPRLSQIGGEAVVDGVVCDFEALPPGGVRSVTITVTADSPGTITNRVSVTSDSVDSDLSNNDAAVDTTLVDVSDGDFDDDGTPDASDCAPSNSDYWTLPDEVPNLRLSHSAITGLTSLTWDPVDPGGAEVRYDAVRSPDAADFLTSWLCVHGDGLATSAGDSGPIASGEVYFYLVRAENGCDGDGLGSAGTDSNGNERMIHDCP